MAIQITITVKDKKKRSSAGEKLFTRKPNAKGKHLIIVESPAKAKTIERILGSNYKVLASMGHLRDLPQRTLGVDVENDFKPEYVNSAERADVIENLQKEANKSKDILLATDPDRGICRNFLMWIPGQMRVLLFMKSRRRRLKRRYSIPNRLI